MQFYTKHPRYFVAVDCVIFGYHNDELMLLVYPRGFEPSKGNWSLMGGFVDEKESADEAAARILKQTTGLENIFLEQVSTFSDPGREPNARVVSVAYYALIRVDEHDEGRVREHGAHWWPITSLPTMVFDHREMVEKALAKLQQQAISGLVGKELLPEKFTLMQLRRLYDAIFQREFDPGNFRKKILSLDLLEKLNVKNISESRKGAFYYRYKAQAPDKEVDRMMKI